MHKIAPVMLLLVLVAACTGADQPHGKEAFPPFFSNRTVFLATIGNCRGKPLPQKISGLTVPHHLLAADLIAEAFSRLQGQNYRRIIILSPAPLLLIISPRRRFSPLPSGAPANRRTGIPWPRPWFPSSVPPLFWCRVRIFPTICPIGRPGAGTRRPCGA